MIESGFVTIAAIYVSGVACFGVGYFCLKLCNQNGPKAIAFMR